MQFSATIFSQQGNAVVSPVVRDGSKQQIFKPVVAHCVYFLFYTSTAEPKAADEPICSSRY